MPTPPYGRATAPWVRFCHILHSTHHSARSRRTRAVSDSTASSGRNSASSRSPALVLGCPFLSFSSTFRSRHQLLYLSSMVGYSNPEIQICKSAKDTRGTTLKSIRNSWINLHSCCPPWEALRRPCATHLIEVKGNTYHGSYSLHVFFQPYFPCSTNCFGAQG